jgi:uncharacterized protein YxjI
VRALVKNNFAIQNIDGSQSYLQKGELVSVLSMMKDEFGNELAVISNEFSLGTVVYVTLLDLVDLN